jgi:hypothetical protein
MSLQTIINSAQSIEFNRSAVVAQSVSRSGRLLTQARNWSKPWQFIVTPPAYLKWSTNRGVIEAILTADRHTEQTVSLATSWLVPYRGDVTRTGGVLDYVTATAVSGTTLTIDVSSASIADNAYIFRAGDVIQFAGIGSDSLTYRYPYVVTADVQKLTGNTTKTVTLNRGYLAQTNYNPLSATNNQNKIKVGTACDWRVKLTKLPNVRYLPGELVEFTDTFEMIESVV